MEKIPVSDIDMLRFENIERVLAVGAHPDDLDFGCGGTIACFVDRGISVTELIVTQGGAGSNDPGMTRERLLEIRSRETKEAAAVLGADLIQLTYEDGHVEESTGLRRDISRVIRSVRPDIVMCMDPQPILDNHFFNHPDHRIVGQVTLDALITGASTRLLFPELLDEGLAPWKPAGAVLMGPGWRSGFVDITKTLDRKIAALLCHASQVDAQNIGDMVRKWTRRVGERVGCTYAETLDFYPVVP